MAPIDFGEYNGKRVSGYTKHKNSYDLYLQGGELVRNVPIKMAKKVSTKINPKVIDLEKEIRAIKALSRTKRKKNG